LLSGLQDKEEEAAAATALLTLAAIAVVVAAVEVVAAIKARNMLKCLATSGHTCGKAAITMAV
jgi:hypothetical protein